ncbi:MAG: hypothetical protein ACAH10_00105 [Methylophilaceae bacterium]
MESFQDISNNIAIGIISGVITTFFIYLFVKIFQRVIEPWYRQLLYKGIDLSGSWYSMDVTMSQEIVFELDQKASSISGIATFINKYGGDHRLEDVRTFSISGFIQDRFLHLVLRHKNSNRLGIVNYLLECVGDGRQLRGTMGFYSVKSCMVDSSQQTLWREKSQAESIYKAQMGYFSKPTPSPRKTNPQRKSVRSKTETTPTIK